MRIFKTIAEIQGFVSKNKISDKIIGFVPTMGALHNGHLSLVKTANQQCDITIASIFVNPTQFNNPEDLEKYPRTVENDIQMLQDEDCNALFLPDAKELYPEPARLNIDFGDLSNQLEGKFRPGHFDGVGLIVSKFFNIIQPHQAFFGQKDLQQFFIIKSLIEQLNFPIALEMVPTVREENGLAMSSRNMRLSKADKDEASLIYSSLREAQDSILKGESLKQVLRKIKELFNASERLNLEYFEVVHTNDFKSIDKVEEREKTAMCIAAEIGSVRLIDNLMLIS